MSESAGGEDFGLHANSRQSHHQGSTGLYSSFCEEQAHGIGYGVSVWAVLREYLGGVCSICSSIEPPPLWRLEARQPLHQPKTMNDGHGVSCDL